MGERKVLNKYFPPDFDPSLVPRRKRPKNAQIEVRMMLPFSLQCSTCGEYMYRGKKFNSRKEEVVEETYHGIRIFRFYIKCITCSSEITFKTDPKRGDYVAEHGCVRNFEPWRESEDAEEAAHQQREDEEKGDSMKALENRTLDSKREMDILDALDEIKAINQRHAKVDTDALLQHHAAHRVDSGAPGASVTQEELARQMEEDLNEAKRAFQAKAASSSSSNSLKRPLGMDDDTSATGSSALGASAAVAAPPVKLIVKKKSVKVKTGKKAKKTPAPVLTSLVAQYSDSDD